MMAENSLMEKRTRSPIIGILTHKEREEGGKIIIAGLCVVSMQGSRELIDTDRIRIDIPVKENAAQIRSAETVRYQSRHILCLVQI